MQVIRWVHEAPVLVAQADIESCFGQPPVTVFRCESFYIDVLFWVDGTTAIHQHRFSGAFHVLEGSSLQSTYEFTPKRRYCDQLLTGDLRLLEVELLKKGDVRPIRSGAGLVHSLFHLDRPSASVVVRTPSDAAAGPQYSYSRAGFAFDPFAKAESTTRKVQILDLLDRIGHPELESIARSTVRAADSFRAFQILTHLLKRVEPHERYLAFLEGIRPVHQELVELLKIHAREEWRDQYIIARRQLVKQPQHRFFLALLLNVRSRARIFELVQGAFPGQAPASVVARWLTELSKLDAILAWVADTSRLSAERQATRILDVALGETEIELLRRAFGDTEHIEAFTCRTAGAVSDAASGNPADELAVSAAMQDSTLLGPLFVP